MNICLHHWHCKSGCSSKWGWKWLAEPSVQHSHLLLDRERVLTTGNQTVDRSSSFSSVQVHILYRVSPKSIEFLQTNKSQLRASYFRMVFWAERTLDKLTNSKRQDTDESGMRMSMNLTRSCSNFHITWFHSRSSALGWHWESHRQGTTTSSSRLHPKLRDFLYTFRHSPIFDENCLSLRQWYFSFAVFVGKNRWRHSQLGFFLSMSHASWFIYDKNRNSARRLAQKEARRILERKTRV